VQNFLPRDLVADFIVARVVAEKNDRLRQNKSIVTEETMFLMTAKSQNFITTAITFSAVMLSWSAEAADVTTTREEHFGYIHCYARNNGPYDVCAVYDVYPVWISGHPTRRTPTFQIPGHIRVSVASVLIWKKPALSCKLISAKYKPASVPCW
jgi:hypothetical protein